MSKQLTLSSVFAVFAMAATALVLAPEQSDNRLASVDTPVQVETASLDLSDRSTIR